MTITALIVGVVVGYVICGLLLFVVCVRYGDALVRGEYEADSVLGMCVCIWPIALLALALDHARDRGWTFRPGVLLYRLVSRRLSERGSDA